MVRTACPALVDFDGYRGLHDGDRTAAAGLTALLGCGDSTYWNNCSERGDSLERRFDRASAWLEVRLGNITEVNVIGSDSAQVSGCTTHPQHRPRRGVYN